MLADEEGCHAIDHLIRPRWFDPDQVLKVTGICSRQHPIFNANFTIDENM